MKLMSRRRRVVEKWIEFEYIIVFVVVVVVVVEEEEEEGVKKFRGFFIEI